LVKIKQKSQSWNRKVHRTEAVQEVDIFVFYSITKQTWNS